MLDKPPKLPLEPKSDKDFILNEQLQISDCHERRLLLIAVGFLTRIPVKISGEFQPAMLEQANRYFGIVGLFIGLLNALFFCLLNSFLPLSLAVLLAMAFSLILTGAFHEDGLADVFDGFGGGWQVSDKLDIMKDSRVGTYGASALVIALLLKYQALVLLADSMTIAISLIVGHCLSRVLATSLIFSMDYVQQDAESKVKPVAKTLSQSGLNVLLVSALFALVALSIFTSFSLGQIFILIAILLLTRHLLKAWLKQQLGGYTGDCLGAAQQISELVTYLVILTCVTSGVVV